MMQDQDPRAHGISTGSDLPPLKLEDLSAKMREAVSRAGWPALMPVQSQAIPYFLAGRDLMVQSRTGSGKTGAFLLPILDRIDPTQSVCQALIMAPTRELALQVSRETEMLAATSGVRTASLYGGVGYGPQLDALHDGAHVVVGTPGRMLDHLMRRTLNLDSLRILIIDEADRLLSVGFYPDMKQLHRYLPNERAGYMFSATYTSSVLALAREFLHEPHFISLSTDAVHVPETEHTYYTVRSMEKDRGLVRIIELENPSSAIVFCNTKVRVGYLSAVLKRFGYDADDLSADLSQAAREEVIARFRAGDLRFLIATDVAARGIDIINLSHVIIYDFPEDPETYIHRAGRTGRAGAAGTVVSLVDVFEESLLRRVVARFGIDLVGRPEPTDEAVAALVTQRVTALLEAKLRARDPLMIERLRRFVPLAGALVESSDERVLLAMLLDDFYQASLHGPAIRAELPQESTSTESRPAGGRPRGRRRDPRRGSSR